MFKIWVGTLDMWCSVLLRRLLPTYCKCRKAICDLLLVHCNLHASMWCAAIR